jgi:membrane protease YdiL (CAAX protease family)
LTIRLSVGWNGVLLAIVLTIAFALIGFTVSMLLVVGYVAIVSPDIRAGLHALQTPTATQTLVQGTAQLLGFLLATVMIGRWMLQWRFSDLRWTRGRVAFTGAGRGLALGAGAAVLAVGSAVLLRTAFWSPDRGGLGDYLAQVAKTTAVLAPAALSEEVMFRGLPLVLLAGVIGRTPALLLISGCVFSLVHGLNPNITGLGFCNIALAGLFLGVVFYAPGGIWTAFGAHLGWNAALAALDAPVSGMPFRIPLFDYHAGPPYWVSGGPFGPEGGVLATLALVGALLVAQRWTRGEQA